MIRMFSCGHACRFRLVLLLVLLLATPAVPAAPGPHDETAAPQAARALAAAEAREGATSPALLPLLSELAHARHRDGVLGEAAALRRRALRIALGAFGCASPVAADAMLALALVEIDRRRYLDAEPLLIIADRLLAEPALQDQAVADPPTIAALSAGLARVALARGESGAALAWSNRSVEIARRHRPAGSTEPLRAHGAALTAEARFAEAEAVLREAVAWDRTHDWDGSETARSLAQLAQLYLRWGRPSDALPLLQEAAAIDQHRLGALHPFIADDLHDLGLVYEALQRPGAARRVLAAAIDLLERGAERDSPRVAYIELELSRLYRRQGDHAAAEAAFRNARRILNRAEAEERQRERRA